MFARAALARPFVPPLISIGSDAPSTLNPASKPLNPKTLNPKLIF